MLMVTSRFRGFGHLYKALVEQGFLQHIPFFDEVLEIYDEMIFTLSCAAAVHGSYNRAYLLSSHLTATSVNAMYRGVVPPAGKEGVKVRKALHFKDISQIYRLLTENDKSVLGGASSKAMLNNVADICSKVLFQTRVLSRDMLRLNDDLTDVFSEMCDELGRRQYHDDYIAGRPQRGESRQYRVNRALEDAVMMPLMPLLDCLQPDGSLDMSAIPTGFRVAQVGTLGGEGVELMCRKAAAVIKAKFATPSLVCEQKYFTFPSKPDFINQEYGTTSPPRVLEGQARHALFDGLMRLLEGSNGPRFGGNLDYPKSELRKNPDLLAMGINSDCWSLFHQAAAGSAHDADLVEWMIQLGALTMQPLHCRYLLLQRDHPFRRADFPNTMAVHSAASAGHEDIVRIILEADNMVDLNTPTYHTKETLAHLAVKHGHRNVYNLFAAFGADLRVKDGNGRRVCDVTTDRQWRREIAASIVEIEKSQAACEGARNQSTTANTPTASKQKKNSKKKKKKGKKSKTTASASTATASNSAVTQDNSEEVSNLLKDLLVAAGSEANASDDSERAALQENTHEQTAAMFARLRDPSISAEDKADDVQRACKLIEKLEGSVEASSHPSRLNSTDRHVRIATASKALQVIHMMQKFHRVDHAAIAVSALASVRQLCHTTLEFTRFVVGTAQLCVSVGRKPQACETYSAARDAMGLGRTSSPDTFLTLEWYLANAVDNYPLLIALDKMVGCAMYSEFTTTSDIDVRHLARFKTAVAAAPELNGVACFDNRPCMRPETTKSSCACSGHYSS
ncbi:hypothetical protein PHYPSEUDO_011774 [Phytophthora pseudosyringae]|uniref:Ankyrin repeat protein n=1 Tax=Phytophthora pseudosyringae TaxID=221518 RepID=A0A8T1W5W4_9STRA|nr:hypothetical protein PHYPSEUDO_011774 [Phytophthora pseudosyringae]